MKKLELKDLAIISEGKQLKKVILDEYGSIEEFAKAISTKTGVNTIKCYIRRLEIKSETFIGNVVKAFDKPLDELIKTKKQQIKDFVYTVNKYMNLYLDKNSEPVLRKLREMCIEEKLEKDLLIMDWNIGRYTYYVLKDRDNALIMLDNAIKEAIKNTYYSLIVKFYSDLGAIYRYDTKPEKARELYNKAVESIKYGCDREVLFHLYYRRGTLDNIENMADSAVENALLALKYSEEIDAYEYIRYAYVTLGAAYRRKRDYEKAMEYYKLALDTCVHKESFINVSSDGDKSHILNNIADLYRHKGDLDMALHYISLAMEYIDICFIKDKVLMVGTYTQIKLALNDYSCLDNLFNIFKKIDNELYIYKNTVLNLTKDICNRAIEINDIVTLNKLREALENMIALITKSDFKKDLIEIVYNIIIYLKEAN